MEGTHSFNACGEKNLSSCGNQYVKTSTRTKGILVSPSEINKRHVSLSQNALDQPHATSPTTPTGFLSLFLSVDKRVLSTLHWVM
ncbi:hypothetical protein CEXT_629071 [Caerostris extrusa]|uniref:Uncharacterized protein n=1 Tax=Caerostris extrusa TaxID=172846 RepID=A0AAV4P3Z0_CAEEX|nr:hypothetical protein CEXT_629071 [Caerostris extrusa]